MSGWRSGFAQNTFSLIFKNKYDIEEKQQFTERFLNSQSKLTSSAHHWYIYFS